MKTAIGAYPPGWVREFQRFSPAERHECQGAVRIIAVHDENVAEGDEDEERLPCIGEHRARR
jgi:hypothetical protein